LIISASRRTDIPAFYSDWFFNRIKEGYVLTRNPMNVRQISKVSLSPEVVDCIVFWTKNPRNILPKLGLLKDYMYYFQFTLTPYDSKIERNLPSKDILIDTFKELSDKIGPERVIWRYDPIIMSNELNPQYHAGRFGDLASKLHRHTKTCIISFVDFYAKARKNLKTIDAKNASEHDIKSIALKLSYIAKNYSLKLDFPALISNISAVSLLEGPGIISNSLNSIA
jgi:hypothetical protein